MDLTAKDAARLLNVPEQTLYAWIRNGTLPSYRVQDRCRINRVELLEWATARQMQVSPEIFQNGSTPLARLLTNALRQGGELRDIECNDKPSALQAVCDRLPLPAHVNRGELHKVLIAREALCSTGLGQGIALPHPRGPLVLGLAEPRVTLAYLQHPVEYGAPDGQPVDKLFVIISTTVHVHLRILSHLMFALQDAGFRALLDQRAAHPELLACVEHIEARIDARNEAKGTHA